MLKHHYSIFCRLALGLNLVILASSCTVLANTGSGISIPHPNKDIPAFSTRGKQVAVFAGGCFWGMEAVFEHLKGVDNVVSGFSGGTAQTASYEIVSSGETAHAESVKITYDPQKISYGQLLEIYFSVAHDPTQLNRQGPDSGRQYRSAIFFADDQQKQVARVYIQQLNESKVFKKPIVTGLEPLKAFYPAEDYHQNFLKNHPDYPYIVINDLPKLEGLKKQFPSLYTP
ncbi:MAG: Peptide methionine sulfoxide reductase MsrA [Chroococcopsis gigantea SAG 12.99]|jgi:peptide-methionine (S)-S-oxide reductase|nr:Peptide methionine sulfoxide reductase MsrA [Chroococcopsis gigantea SAG 12.99]